MGRWLSRDPIAERGGENLYGFVADDPVGRWDGLGLVGMGELKQAERCCCCCVEDLKLDFTSVKLVDSERSWGHISKTNIKLSYKAANKSSDCKLEWWERTDTPYTPSMQANGPMAWNDMIKDPDPKVKWTFDNQWGKRDKPCPGTETRSDSDAPIIPKSWGTASSVLQFVIVVKSRDDCPCAKKSITVFATQKLSIKNGKGDQQSFEPGGVDGPWPVGVP